MPERLAREQVSSITFVCCPLAAARSQPRRADELGGRAAGLALRSRAQRETPARVAVVVAPGLNARERAHMPRRRKLGRTRVGLVPANSLLWESGPSRAVAADGSRRQAAKGLAAVSEAVRHPPVEGSLQQKTHANELKMRQRNPQCVVSQSVSAPLLRKLPIYPDCLTDHGRYMT